MIETKRPFKLIVQDGKYVVQYLDTNEVKDITKQMRSEEIKMYKQDKEAEEIEKELKKKK